MSKKLAARVQAVLDMRNEASTSLSPFTIGIRPSVESQHMVEDFQDMCGYSEEEACEATGNVLLTEQETTEELW